ncbi:MAG: C45 family peptidase [bacterium]
MRLEPIRVTRVILSHLLLLATLFPSAACSEDDPPSGEVRQQGHIKVVWLRGTPYEMGLQHAELLHDELVAGRAFVDDDFMFSTMLGYADNLGLDVTAAEHSYESTLEECRGLADGMDGVWTLEECLVLNYGDVVVEILKMDGLGCSQFVANGSATTDGELIHGRNLDWWEVEFIEQNPVIFVREPAAGIPWVSVGFPANMSPYTGMNLMGIAVASNEISAPLETELKREGRSHVQMVREILRSTTSFEEAEAFLRAQDHAPAETLVVSDGPGGKAAAFEMTAYSFQVRTLSGDGLVYATNHFVHPDMEATQEPEPEGTSSWNRFERLRQLLEPGEAESLYGSLDVPGAISILRDSYNPSTQEWVDPFLIDGGDTLANNGAMQSVVFVPARGLMYVAVGEFPVTVLQFVGFSVDDLTGQPNATPPNPASYPALSAP